MYSPRCYPPSLPWLPSAPAGPEAKSQHPYHGQPEKVSLCLVFHLQSFLGMESILLGCAGETQKRTSLRLWLEGPKQVESGVRCTLRTAGRTKAEGAQVCCIHLDLGPGGWCEGRHWLRQATQAWTVPCPSGGKEERETP